jgi:Icc-related predicted phosphoesterase
MKYALISDIHGNLPALEAVLADIDREAEVDAIYHLGDLVGYAPWPNEVVTLIRERAHRGSRATTTPLRPPTTPTAAARPQPPR